ncbi:TPA: AAA family ATPase [Burkholderia cepacia]|nr:hypothetical protein BZY94_06405 [Burkholderia territorii]HDR9497093.1 AAA family ATPase [Burkholderia cepacia]
MQSIYSPEVPVLLVGAPGVGKTASVRAHFDYAEVLLTSTLVEEDIAGLPYREGEYDYRTTSAVFRRLHDAANAGKSTVLFLDELDKARRAVADTLLTLVASRQVGAAELPSTTCIVAAANPPEFGGGDGISDAMLSRFSVVEYVPNPAKWADLADASFGPEVHRITEAARTGEMPIFDMVGEGFSKRITTPRTLDKALSAIVRCGAESEEAEMIVRGLLTPGTATQMLHFARQLDNDVMHVATQSARKGISGNSKHTPVRL